VAQRVRTDVPGQSGQIHGRFEALLGGSDRLAIELDEAGADQLAVFPTSHVGQQPGWKWSGRLTLLGGSLPDRRALEDTTLEISVRVSKLGVRRCRRDRDRPGAGDRPITINLAAVALRGGRLPGRSPFRGPSEWARALYRAGPRIDAGWPGSFSLGPISLSLPFVM
jgi:hypothetical protein